MVIAVRYGNKYTKLVLLFIFFIIGLLIPTKNTLAMKETTVGFLIEASSMEGTPLGIGLVTGDTANQKSRPMLGLKFADASVQDLKIKKLVNTPKGMVTTGISSEDSALFDTLNLKVTNAEFGDIYVPELGKIGFHNVKLLAHEVGTGNASLPEFSLEFQAGGEAGLQPKSKTELEDMKDKLDSLISSLGKSDAQ